MAQLKPHGDGGEPEGMGRWSEIFPLSRKPRDGRNFCPKRYPGDAKVVVISQAADPRFGGDADILRREIMNQRC